MKDLAYSEHEGYAVVVLPAGLDQNDWLAFRGVIHRQFIDRGLIALVFDCEASPDLPSIAFGAFASLARDLRRAGGSLNLVHVSERIRQVLVRTRMDNFVPVHGTLTEVFRRTPKPPPGGA